MTVSLLTLGDPGQLTGGYLYHRRMAEAAPRHGASVRFVSVPERPFPLAVLDAGRVLESALASRPDALVLDSIAAAFVAPWLWWRHPGAPVVGSLHQPPGGIDHGPARSRAQSALDLLAYRRASLLIVASASLAEGLERRGIPACRLRVVPPGNDVASGDEGTEKDGARQPAVTRPADARRGRAAALLCVANWVPRKGILELLEAVAALPAGAATLHLAGDPAADPAYGRAVRARLARADLRDRVVVHGPLSRLQVAQLYRAADVFVLASYREPYGTVYGEAMAAGLPVVGWEAGNLPHLAVDEREALLVPPGDVRGLTRALERLAGDESLRRRLGEAAAARARSRPDWEGSAGLFFSAVREAVHAWGGGPRARNVR